MATGYPTHRIKHAIDIERRVDHKRRTKYLVPQITPSRRLRRASRKRERCGRGWESDELRCVVGISARGRLGVEVREERLA